MSGINHSSGATLSVVKDVLAQYYAHQLTPSEESEPDKSSISVSEGQAQENENWRVKFIIKTARQQIKGAVFQGTDGRYYIDDARNRNGTSVYQNIDGYFR